ncbi:MAG TPA: nickel pincer cofactor biosynthesis protein LarC [Ktedonobacterales bacterium]|nr:nickel pincer cofactor biosynthesis protein LarC [Ktedonobacterales bacterium]
MRLAYLDCFSGMSGDMFLGALLDAGLPLEHLQAGLAALRLEGYRLALEPYTDKGIRGKRFSVQVTETPQPERHLSEIQQIITASQLPRPVQQRALAVFQALGEAEAQVHGVSVEQVHFHEVGAVDALVDIVGAAIGLHELGIERVYASPLPLTTGQVQTAHGLLPVPAPATLELLRRVGAPWTPRAAEGELVTPTAAAILATWARFETPAMVMRQVGYGFGRKQLPWANCLRLCLGEPVSAGAVETDEVMVIETNLDNLSGEVLGEVMERLFQAGALDVTYTPMQMKKNRPATQVSVIAPLDLAEDLALLLLRETTTLGVRLSRWRRLKAGRRQELVETPLGQVRVKLKLLEGRVVSVAPEYEDCRKLAEASALSLREVYERLDGFLRERYLPKAEQSAERPPEP